MTGGTNSFFQEFMVDAHAAGDPRWSSPRTSSCSAGDARVTAEGRHIAFLRVLSVAPLTVRSDKKGAV